MDQKDRMLYIERYSDRLKKYGYSPKSLGWGKSGRQDIRFSVLAQMAISEPFSSVLDVGCGFGDLYGFLLKSGWQGDYLGIDIVPHLIKKGSDIFEGINLQLIDITSTKHSDLAKYDYVISSGIFNAKLTMEDNKKHIEKALHNMFNHAKVALCCDFMSTYVDFQQPDSWHTEPTWVFNVAKKLSKRVLLRHDYMPYEFALFVFCDDGINESNCFSSFSYN